mgnify:CR=1 FL=1
MITVGDLRKNKRFLSADQTYNLLQLITAHCSKPVKLQMSSILKNSFYSLEDREYWKKLVIHDDNFVEYKGDISDIKSIRLDILNQHA